MSGPHELLNPPALAPPRGFSHAVAAAPGRIVYIGGQAGMDSGWKLVEGGLVAQFDAAAANVVTALAAAQGEPRHLVQIHIFVTSAADYRAALEPLGKSWRRHFGRHYPAVALFEVAGLFEPGALVELTGVAVVPP